MNNTELLVNANDNATYTEINLKHIATLLDNALRILNNIEENNAIGIDWNLLGLNQVQEFVIMANDYTDNASNNIANVLKETQQVLDNFREEQGQQ